MGSWHIKWLLAGRIELITISAKNIGIYGNELQASSKMNMFAAGEIHKSDNKNKQMIVIKIFNRMLSIAIKMYGPTKKIESKTRC